MRFFTLYNCWTIGIALILSSHSVFSQVTPPSAFSSGVHVNYIRTWDVFIPQSNASTFTMATPLDSARITTQYIDGLGKPVQTVVKNGSMVTGSSAVDFVSANVYDNLSREVYQYLPFAANNAGSNSSINDGRFKLNPFQEQAQFSSAQYPGETYYYGKTSFEASALNRPLQTFPAGNSWVGASGGGRGVSQKYYINTSTDAVRVWKVTEPGSNDVFGTYQTTSTYSAGELYKNISEDEHGKQVIEFKDKYGKVILKKVQLTATSDDGAGRTHTGWLCTYYIYDDFGRLRAVIQPSGVESLASGSWTPDGTMLAEQFFRYEYDEYSRMVAKKVPGEATVQMAYDQRDRLVMMQDGNLLALAKWHVTTYDELNRPIQTGLVSNSDIQSRTAAQHRSYASVSTAYPFASTNTPSSYELLTKTGYDNYTNLPSGAPSATLDGSVITGNFFTSYNAAPEYAQEQSQSLQVTGLPTWSQTKVLGTSTYLYTVSIYDEKGRAIQVKSTNISGGIDVATTQFDFSGKVLRTHLKHQKSGTNADVYQVLTKMEYDLLGRLATVKKRINKSTTSITTDKTILTNNYNALGQVKTKSIGQDPVNTSTALETLNYKYNIRGWIQSMNGDYVDGSGSSRFGYKLAYDKEIYGTTASSYAAQYNGNISSSIWRSKGDGEIRRYDYAYDAANRLSKADFTQFTGGTFNVNAGIDYSVGGSSTNSNKMSYDANGNILEMWQKGWKLSGSSWIDQMSYNYFTGSNRLKNVVDAAQDKTTKLGDFRYSTAYETALGSSTKSSSVTDYDYDVNGNLVKDLNKDIKDGSNSGITYNHLNLPSLIKVEGKGSIEYVYDATGIKLKKIVHETGLPDVVTTYMAGIYQNDTLQFLGHEEGRARFSADVNQPVVYDYMIKDHLGNVRMLITEEQKIDKYPVASLETSKLSIEQAYYNINTNQIANASSVTGLTTYTNDNGIGNNPSDATFEAANSQKLYFLNSNNAKTGLGITLKVMAGDKLDIFGKSYYFQNNTGGSSANSAVGVLEILNGFLGAPAGAVSSTIHAGVTGTTLSSISSTTSGITSLLSNQTTDNNQYTTRPKAYINYILFDEQFKSVSSGFSVVGANSTIKNHYQDLQNIQVPKNGYVYIYCSNESPVNVYFDNLQVVHTRGRITEETHYYPFGLTMQGISSKAANGVENKLKYNGIEQNTDFDMNMYDAHYRNLDPQIGRFWQLDSKPTEFFSLYAAMQNNPVLFSDPFGDKIKVDGTEDEIKTFKELLKKTTGNTYDVVDGYLQRTNKNINKKSDKKKSATLSKTIEDGITAEKETTLTLLSNNEGESNEILFDDFKSGSLDLDDYQKIDDNTFLAAKLGHGIAENLGANADLSKRDYAEYKKLHNGIATTTESSIVAEMDKKKYAKREETTKLNVSKSDPNKLESITVSYRFGATVFSGTTTVSTVSTRPSGTIIKNFKRK